MRVSYTPAALLALTALAGCEALPRDPDGTVAALQSGRPVRAAIVAGGPSAPAARAAVERVADGLGTTVAWSTGAGEPLLHALEQGDLDVVIGRFAKQSPWMTHVALSRAVGEPEPSDASQPATRLARANGENRWIMLLDREIAR